MPLRLTFSVLAFLCHLAHDILITFYAAACVTPPDAWHDCMAGKPGTSAQQALCQMVNMTDLSHGWHPSTAIRQASRTVSHCIRFSSWRNSDTHVRTAFRCRSGCTCQQAFGHPCTAIWHGTVGTELPRRYALQMWPATEVARYKCAL